MKKRWLCGVLALLFCLISCVGCSDKEPIDENDNSLVEQAGEKEPFSKGIITLYFTNEERTQIFPIDVDLDFSAKNNSIKIREIINCLVDPSMQYRADESWKSVIPEDVLAYVDYHPSTSLSEWEKSESLIVVWFNDSYLELPQNSKVVLLAGIIKVLQQLNLADVIKFSCAYEEIYQVKSSQEFAINQYGEDFFSGSVEVTLFFVNRDGTALRRERRELSLGITDPLFKAVVNALISGPNSSDAIATIPAGTVLKDIFVKNGVCYVDFNAEFQKNYLGGETLEKLTIYSIVNSLCSISGINKVQILIDGKRVDTYQFSVSLRNFLDRDLTLVE